MMSEVSSVIDRHLVRQVGAPNGASEYGVRITGPVLGWVDFCHFG